MAISTDEQALLKYNGGSFSILAYCVTKQNRRTIHQVVQVETYVLFLWRSAWPEKKKFVNKTNIPEHEIEKIARCLFPDILALYNSEEGQKEFEEWKKMREKIHSSSEA